MIQEVMLMQSSHYWLSRFLDELRDRTSGRGRLANAVRSENLVQRGFASDQAAVRREGGTVARNTANPGRGRRRRRSMIRIRQTLQPFWYRA
jgi:hypothetical protein